MAYTPNNSTVDDFSSVSGHWVDDPYGFGMSHFDPSGGVFVPQTNGQCMSAWDASRAFDDGIEMLAKVSTKPGDGKECRLTLGDESTNGNGYTIRIQCDSGVDVVTLCAMVDGTTTGHILATFNMEVASGDWFWLHYYSGVLSLLYQSGSSGWVLLTQVADSRWAGYTAIHAYLYGNDNVLRWDDFSWGASAQIVTAISPAAQASASSIAPLLLRGAANAVASAPAPTVVIVPDVLITPSAMTATASCVSPTISIVSSSTIISPVAEATASASSPRRLEKIVIAPPAIAWANQSKRILAPVAKASAIAPPPPTVGTPTDTTIFATVATATGNISTHSVIAVIRPPAITALAGQVAPIPWVLVDIGIDAGAGTGLLFGILGFDVGPDQYPAYAEAPAPVVEIRSIAVVAESIAAGIEPTLFVVTGAITSPSASATASAPAPTIATTCISPAAEATAERGIPSLLLNSIIFAAVAEATGSISTHLPLFVLEPASANADAVAFVPLLDISGRTVIVAPAAIAVATSAGVSFHFVLEAPVAASQASVGPTRQNTTLSLLAAQATSQGLVPSLESLVIATPSQATAAGLPAGIRNIVISSVAAATAGVAPSIPTNTVSAVPALATGSSTIPISRFVVISPAGEATAYASASLPTHNPVAPVASATATANGIPKVELPGVVGISVASATPAAIYISVASRVALATGAFSGLPSVAVAGVVFEATGSISTHEPIVLAHPSSGRATAYFNPPQLEYAKIGKTHYLIGVDGFTGRITGAEEAQGVIVGASLGEG